MKHSRAYVSLIQEFDTENDEITIVDPATGVAEIRRAKFSRLIQVLKSYETNRLGGFWIVSRKKWKETQNSTFLLIP